jgi:hypothetical protein
VRGHGKSWIDSIALGLSRHLSMAGMRLRYCTGQQSWALVHRNPVGVDPVKPKTSSILAPRS